MRIFRILACTLLSGLALGGKSQSKDKFSQFHSKLVKSGPLKLDDATYERLTNGPRDYSSVVLLTAMDPRYGCQVCREFESHYDILSRSWTGGDKGSASRLLFGVLDFNDGRNTFQSLGLQTAPVILLFHPNMGPHAVVDNQVQRLDFKNGLMTAEQVHAWTARNLPDRPHPKVKRPINWIRGLVITTIILGTVTAISVAWPYMLPVIQNRNVWAGISLIAILLFTSGHMFNHIRKVPYVAGDGHGGVSYFARGFSAQYGLETQIVAAIYGLLSFATISLALKAPRIADPRIQQATILVWGAVIFFMYGFLLSVFRLKNGGYPFWLPPFA